MKGVILAGGTGSRLAPLTKVTNKHLLPVYDKPMIYYPIEKLVAAGVKDILIISGPGHAGHFLNLLGSGKEFGARFMYDIQEEASGIAGAVALAERFVDGEPFVVHLGDNIFAADLSDAFKEYEAQGSGARIFLKEVEHPEQLGVAEVQNGKIVRIVEKPKEYVSNLAVIGVYCYDATIFEFVKTLKPSARGELEITDVNQWYLEKQALTYSILEGWWGDGGESFDSLLEAGRLAAEFRKKN
ncbi:MAG: sugar phosphate nucleotidyltransferase [Patescibacteria group bacterium]|jgi:glucose-1-phosphate thymidylyltransferase